MFNREKYEKCIGHLVSQKFTVIFTYALIFAAIGAGIGCAIMFGADTSEASLFAGLIIGLVIGIMAGISATWKIEMRIQEAYWRIEMLAELKSSNSKPEKTAKPAEEKKE